MHWRRAFIVPALTLGLVVGPAPSPARAEERALRSGTIVGGAGVELAGGQPWEQPAAERSGCQYALDCAAWVHSGCQPSVVGHTPSMTASIVDVGELSDGTTPFSLEMTAPPVPPWGLYPGVVIQFWRQDCTEIPDTKLHSLGSDSTCEGYVGGGFGRCRFRIPVAARWMTLSGYVTTAALSWTLT